MIYLYCNIVPPDEKLDSLPYLRRAAADYLERKGSQEKNFAMKDGRERKGRQESFTIEKTEKGKPILNVPGVFVSATHTQRQIICGISDENLGIDAELPEQRGREIPYEKIAGRFFTPLEQRYVKSVGREGFYEIWVRKEAYMKYTGQGMAYGFQNIETRKDDGFSQEIDGCPIRFQRIGSLFFACAGGTEELKWMNEPAWMNGTQK